MNESLYYDVVIVGAGIAGSTLAKALDGSGIKVLLLESGEFASQAPSCDNTIDGFDARVSALTLHSKQLLTNLGVWHTLEQLRLQCYCHISAWDGEGTAGVIDFDAAEISEKSLGYIVENRVLIYALINSLAMSTNIKLLANAKIDHLARSLEGYRFDIEGREIQAQLLVGADGANSFVRQQLNFDMREWSYEHQGIVCTVQTEKPHKATAWQRFSYTGPLALLPLPSSSKNEHFCSVVWSQTQKRAIELLALDDEAFARQLAQEFEHRLGAVVAVSQRFSFPLSQRHAVNYIKKSAVLVGDAAHTIHPLAGQGINLGLKDVEVLAEELLKAHHAGISLSDKQCLARYQRRRKADNLAMMALMEGFKRLFGEPSALVGLIRNKGMQLVGGASILKRQLIKRAVGK